AAVVRTAGRVESQVPVDDRLTPVPSDAENKAAGVPLQRVGEHLGGRVGRPMRTRALGEPDLLVRKGFVQFSLPDLVTGVAVERGTGQPPTRGRCQQVE